MAGLSEKQVAGFRHRLEQRRDELLGVIRDELLKSDNERYIDLAERVHDVGEQSVADLLSDLDLAVVDRHLAELRDTEQALQRIQLGTYGVCQECGGEIRIERLEVNPTAERCLECQERYEETHAGEGKPSL